MKHNHTTCPVCVRRANLSADSIDALKEELRQEQAERAELAREHSSYHLQSHEKLRVDEGEIAEVRADGRHMLKSRSGFRVQPTFFCDKCSTSWPCPTYLWATRSEPFRLMVQPNRTNVDGDA